MSIPVIPSFQVFDFISHKIQHVQKQHVLLCIISKDFADALDEPRPLSLLPKKSFINSKLEASIVAKCSRALIRLKQFGVDGP